MMLFCQTNNPDVFKLWWTTFSRTWVDSSFFTWTMSLSSLHMKRVMSSMFIQVLQCLLNNLLFVKSEKYGFHASIIAYLSFIILEGSIFYQELKQCWCPAACPYFPISGGWGRASPVLTLLVPLSQFILEVDVSEVGIKAAVSQHAGVIFR